MHYVWKGAGVYPTCAVKLQPIKTQRRTQNTFVWVAERLPTDKGLSAFVPLASTQPKPLYQNDQVTAYWDVPVYADHTEKRANKSGREDCR